MSIVIRGQILITTNMDRHGEQLSKDELFRCFNQMPDTRYLSPDHDQSKPPIGKAINKQFIQLPSGEYAITMDVEIFDEKNLEKYKGFSVAYTKNGFVKHLTESPKIRILYNPRIYESKAIEELVSLEGSHNVAFLELHEKAYDVTAAKVIVSFISLAVASGFFGEIGADIYKSLKSGIKELRPKDLEKSYVRFEVPIEIDGGVVVDLMLNVLAKDMDIIPEKGLLSKSPAFIKGRVGAIKIKKAAIKIVSQEPYMELLYAIDCGDNLIQ